MYFRSTSTNHIYRYPGIRPFNPGESSLFFGREKESQDLYHAIKAQPLTILFAKSGIGKSSLINAGVLPVLIQDNFTIIPIRFQDTTYSPLLLFSEQLEKFILQEEHTQIASQIEGFNQRYLGEGQKPTLWHQLKALSLVCNPIFILDQFEEFFNHDKESRAIFLRNFSEMMQADLPPHIVNSLEKIPRKERGEHKNWFSPINIKFLFAIRADRLSLLDEMTPYVPTVLRTRFQLLPLTTDNARQAILRPASLSYQVFSSFITKEENASNDILPPFGYAEETLQMMIENLKDPKEGEIEAFQLQILCQNIEIKLFQEGHSLNIERVEALSDAPPLQITPDYVGGSVGIANMLNNYYENKLGEIVNEDDRKKARNMMEEGLIRKGVRVSLPEIVIMDEYDIDLLLLEFLVNSRLIRVEETKTGRMYEVSHDTLVQPILKSYQQRHVEEERLRLALEKEAQEKEIETQRNRAEEQQALREKAEETLREVLLLKDKLSGMANSLQELRIKNRNLELEKIKMGQRPKLYLICIGINTYTDFQLTGCVNDVLWMREIFQGQKGKLFEEIEVHVFIEQEVVKKDIFAIFQQITQHARSEDYIIISFAGASGVRGMDDQVISGYGQTMAKKGGYAEPLPSKGAYFFCYGEVDGQKNPDWWDEYALGTTDLAQYFLPAQAKVLLLLDIAYGEWILEDFIRANKENIPNNVFGLSATLKLQLAKEMDLGGEKRGVFSYAIEQALKTPAADVDGNGVIYLDELYYFVEQFVREKVSEQDTFAVIPPTLTNIPIFQLDETFHLPFSERPIISNVQQEINDMEVKLKVQFEQQFNFTQQQNNINLPPLFPREQG